MRFKITENYIVKYATLTCVQNENVSSCTANGPDSKYTGHHNLFQLIPERYLRDKDVAEFLDKIDQFLAGKIEYQFEPIEVDK